MAGARLSGTLALLAAAGLALGACASQPLPASLPMAEALESAAAGGRAAAARALRERLAAQETFGYVAPYVPVVLPPDIRRAWVPTHQSAEGELIAGHWVYLRLTDFRWFTEAPPVPLTLGTLPAPPPAEPPPPPPPWPPASAPAPPQVPWAEGTPAATAGERAPSPPPGLAPPLQGHGTPASPGGRPAPPPPAPGGAPR